MTEIKNDSLDCGLLGCDIVWSCGCLLPRSRLPPAAGQKFVSVELPLKPRSSHKARRFQKSRTSQHEPSPQRKQEIQDVFFHSA
jgi:hypothetical protein